MFFPRGNESQLSIQESSLTRALLLLPVFQLAFQKEPMRVLNYWETLISERQMLKEFRTHVWVHRDGTSDIFMCKVNRVYIPG